MPSPAKTIRSLFISVWLLLILGMSSSCERPKRPWDVSADAAVVDDSKPFLPGKPPRWRPDASSGRVVATRTAQSSSTGVFPHISAVGGLWVSCYGGFRPSGEPLKDVTRLGLMCGPVNGMKLVTDKPMVGQLALGQTHKEHRFVAEAGECYRVFAVASNSVKNLDVTVRSLRGSRLASDHSEDNWPIVDPDRPFCTFESDTFVLEFSSPAGAGRFAAQVWKLPPRE